jgi:hypothetical protein
MQDDWLANTAEFLLTWMTWFLKSAFSLSFRVRYSTYRMLMRYAVQLPISP